MGLLQNGYRHNLIGRLVGTTNLDGWRPEVGVYQRHRAAANRNQVLPGAVTDNKSAVPNGNRAPSAWIMPNKGGGLSSRDATLAFTATATGIKGLPGEGSTSFSITTNTPDGQLIVSGSGSVTFSLDTNAPLLTASLNGAGTTSFSLTTNTPILGAEASLTGEASFVVTTNSPVIFPLDDDSPLRTATASFSFGGSLTSYAIGSMTGTTEEAGLSNAGIANSVWGKVIEAGYSAEQVMRLIGAFAAGSATGLENGNPQFTGLDGTTVRIDGAYSAGTRSIDALNGD